VWPHDNSLIALGFARYGFTAEAGLVADDVQRAAGFFAGRQLPELYAGLQRDATSFPVQYLGANVPQAWAAGSVFALLQAMLGLVFDAPRGRILVQPALPEWLPDVTVYGLRVGDHTVDVAFERRDDGTVFRVVRGDAAAVQLSSSLSQ
jgi:glycogen debranching enzyme